MPVLLSGLGLPLVPPAPDTLSVSPALYSGSTAYYEFSPLYTSQDPYSAGLEWVWQTSTNGNTSTATWAAAGIGPSLQVGITSGTIAARCQAKSLAGAVSGWVYSANLAYAAPASATAVFVSPVSGYQALLQVAPGYQLAPGNAAFVSAPLLTDKTSGDSTTGYKGIATAAAKPSSPTFQSGNSIASGIIAAWPVYEGSGSTVHDISGNALNLSFSGTPTWATGPNGAVLACTYNNGLTIADNALLKPTAGFTFSALVNATSPQSGGNGRYFRKDSSTGGYFSITGGNSYHDTSGTAYSTTFAVGTGYLASYHLYTYTFNTSTNLMSLYIDGNLFGTVSGSGTLTWDTAAQYIMGNAVTTDGLAGSLDVCYEWNRALSASEVASLAANPYQLIGTSSGGNVITALLSPGTLGVLPINTIKMTRTWSQQLSEVLEYSMNGTIWTAIPTGYTPGNNAGTATSLQTTVAIGSTLTPLYLRYSGKDTGTGAAILLTDFSVS